MLPLHGFILGISNQKRMDKLSYALGLGIGRQLAQMGATSLSIDDFATAIKDVLAGAELKVSDQEAQTLVQEFSASRKRKPTPKWPKRERRPRPRASSIWPTTP